MIRYRFSGFEADLESKELRRNGSRVPIQPQPFRILSCLLEASGGLVTRETLIEALWGNTYLADPGHSLNIAMGKLRNALEDCSDEPRFIETVARQGYRFVGEVEALESDPPMTAMRRPYWHRPAIATLAIIILSTSVWFWLPLRARTLAFAGSGATDRILYSALDASHPRPSRDGRFVAFLCGRAICQLDAETRAVRTVVPAPSTPQGQLFRPLSSPNGEWMAYGYISNVTDNGDLRIVRADGAQDRLLIGGDRKKGEYFSPADWTRDGKSLLAATKSRGGTGLLLVPLSGGAPRNIAAPDLEWFSGRDNVKISPDGKWIAYPSVKPAERRFGFSPTDVNIMPATGGPSWTVFAGKGAERVIGWLPNGDLLAHSDRSGVQQAYRVPLSNGKPGGEPEKLTEMADWQIVGTSVTSGAVYMTRLEESSDLYAHTPGSSAPRRLLLGFQGRNRHPAVSPDGQTLVYAVGVSPSDSTLVVRDLRSGQEQRLPHRLTWIRSLHWFPDNRSILAVTFSGEFRTMTMYRINTRTADLKTFPLLRETDGAWASPSVQADGRTVVFLGGVPRAIRSLNLDTMSTKTLIAPRDRYSIRRPVVSPDGRLVAYIERDDSVQRSRLVVSSLDSGSKPHILYDCPAGSCRLDTGLFTPDGRDVIFYRSEGNSPLLSLSSVPAAGGEAKPYLSSNIPIGYPSFSPGSGEIIASSTRFTGHFRAAPLSDLTSQTPAPDLRAQRRILDVLTNPIEVLR
ncbi:MAG: winged helix-turn-helix domain-containing protein [Acidobacteria bacterium]|nr:winged helix-turn-helix domain-containing protein [Acidobacteriota bacterium]